MTFYEFINIAELEIRHATDAAAKGNTLLNFARVRWPARP